MSDFPNRNLFEELRKLLGMDFRILENPAGDPAGLGWHSRLVTSDGLPLAGGTSADRLFARRIAVAEAFERGLVRKLSRSASSRKDLRLDEVPSCSGFAAGFQKSATRLRAAYEAIERWAWAKWIDEGHFVPERREKPSLSGFENFLASSFERLSFYEHRFPVLLGKSPEVLSFKVFLGFHSGGVFPGSRVSGLGDNSWLHPLVEASRNFTNFGEKACYPLHLKADDVITQRACHFARSAASAERQIQNARTEKWPLPSLETWMDVPTGIEGVFLARAICGGHAHWHEGPVERFVY